MRCLSSSIVRDNHNETKYHVIQDESRISMVFANANFLSFLIASGFKQLIREISRPVNLNQVFECYTLYKFNTVIGVIDYYVSNIIGK